MSVPITDQRRYPPGVPSWVDTAQPDPAAAARFYSELFGWELTEAMSPDAPGSYLIATLDGHDVAAVGQRDPDEPKAWRTYVACDDADATRLRGRQGQQRATRPSPVPVRPTPTSDWPPARRPCSRLRH